MSDTRQNYQTLTFRKATIPPPAPKITLKNSHILSRKSHLGSDFHISSRTEYNRSMKLSGTPFLAATYKG
jgi:hypothetical protein